MAIGGPSSSSSDEIDLDLSLLVAQLGLTDIDEIKRTHKGKTRADAPIRDSDYALRVQEDEMRAYLAFMEDIRIAQSLGEAMDADQGILEALRVEEQGFADDHRYAEALSHGQALPEQSQEQKSLEDPEFLRSL